MNVAIVDELRALPRAVAFGVLDELEDELGPEALASLASELTAAGDMLGFWSRPSQRLPPPDDQHAVVVIKGEYGTGKTWLGVQYFLREILAGRAKRPRIICATAASFEGTVINGPSGILQWLPAGVTHRWFPTKGHAGELWIGDVRVVCASAAEEGQAIGEASDLDLCDDVAKWVLMCGEERARKAWAAARKSLRVGQARAIIPTTADGAEFIAALARGDGRSVLVIDLGTVEDNRGNLAPNFVEVSKLELEKEGLWSSGAVESPWGPVDFSRLRQDVCPRLFRLGVSIDPAESSTTTSCEVGIVGGGCDERSTVHARYDASAVLDAGKDGWPSRAWDLAEQMQREHPGASIVFVIETNRGSNQPAALLRGEERIRRLRRGLPEHSMCKIIEVRSSTNKCARAVSPARLALERQVLFAPGLDVLQTQLKKLTPAGKKSDRADALNQLVNHLAGLDDDKQARAAAEERERADAVSSQCAAAAAYNQTLAMRRGAVAPPPRDELIKIPGAPPGDARYAGPPPRQRAPHWRTRKTL